MSLSNSPLNMIDLRSHPNVTEAIFKDKIAGRVEVLQNRAEAAEIARNEEGAPDMNSWLIYFTDASKQGKGMGGAHTRPVCREQGIWDDQALRMPPEMEGLDINNGELVWIEQAAGDACQHCEANTGSDSFSTVTNVIIYSDSLASLRRIEAFHRLSLAKKQKFPRIRELAFLWHHAHRMEQLGVSLVLRWAPSHEDIEGNIRADKLAKYAAQDKDLPFLDIPSNGYLIPNHQLPDLAPWVHKFKTTKVHCICREKQREISARTKDVLRRVRFGRIVKSRSQDVELVDLQIQKEDSLQIVPVRKSRKKARKKRALSAGNSPIKAVASSGDAGLTGAKRKTASKKQKLIQPLQPRDERQLAQLNTASMTQDADTNFAGPFDVTLGGSKMDKIMAMVKTGLEHFCDFFRN